MPIKFIYQLSDKELIDGSLIPLIYKIDDFALRYENLNIISILTVYIMN